MKMLMMKHDYTKKSLNRLNSQKYKWKILVTYMLMAVQIYDDMMMRIQI